ncbi:MAG: hypothetical protein C4575_09570 [Desulforudis sp.]|jgi:hypothetical protein|nr:MAG: hypothetical protein C4575_09570 [Desulforudis sp.]
MNDKEIVEIDVEIIWETSDAVWVTDGFTRAWLPKSQIKLPDDVNEAAIEPGQTLTVELPAWLAEDRGLG